MRCASLSAGQATPTFFMPPRSASRPSADTSRSTTLSGATCRTSSRLGTSTGSACLCPVQQGRVAAENAVLGTRRRFTHELVPTGSFTDPEYGGVGGRAPPPLHPRCSRPRRVLSRGNPDGLGMHGRQPSDRADRRARTRLSDGHRRHHRCRTNDRAPNGDRFQRTHIRRSCSGVDHTRGMRACGRGGTQWWPVAGGTKWS
jgi:hypothetical protein